MKKRIVFGILLMMLVSTAAYAWCTLNVFCYNDCIRYYGGGMNQFIQTQCRNMCTECH